MNEQNALREGEPGKQTLAPTEPLGHADQEAAQYALLRLLAERPDLSQRELSERLGLSLGKTHYVLHALLDRGLVKVRNFRRSRHKLNYAYVLTPSGLTEKLRLTRLFLRRKESEFEALQQAIQRLRSELNGEAANRDPD